MHNDLVVKAVLLLPESHCQSLFILHSPLHLYNCTGRVEI